MAIHLLQNSVVVLQYTDLRDETVPCHKSYGGEILNVVSFLYSEDSKSSLSRQFTWRFNLRFNITAPFC